MLIEINTMTAWVPFLVFLVPLSVAVGGLYLWLQYLKNSNDKFPFKDSVPRNPGESLTNKLAELSFDMSMYLLMSVLIPLITYAIYLQHIVDMQKPPTVVVAGMLLVIASVASGWSLIKLFRIVRDFRQYRTGLAGELAVGGALNQLMLQGYRVFHDIEGDKLFNVDHILVGPAGVFAIETKTRRKKKKVEGGASYKVTYDGKALHFADNQGRPHRAFLEQSIRNAKWVSKWLSASTGQPVIAQPVLVMPGWFIEIKKPGDVRVLNHNQVQSLTWQASKPVLDDAAIERIAYQVQQRCCNDYAVPKALVG